MFWRVAIIVFLGICTALLFSKTVWGPTGLMEYRALQDRYKELRERIATLDAENLAISTEIRLLRSDRKYVEKMIREKLHYLRDNEMVYIFANPENGQRGAKQNDGKN